MPLLAVALVLAVAAIPVLGYVRLKSGSEEIGKLIAIAAAAASFSLSAALAFSVLDGLTLLGYYDRNFHSLNSWKSYALIGVNIGLNMYILMRVIVFGIGIALYRWSCRLPPSTEETVGRRAGTMLLELVGFILAFIGICTLVYLVESTGFVMLLVPVFVSLIPLYETLVLPWFQHIRSPSLKSEDMADVQAWIDDLCAKRKIPRFHIRVQTGTMANAYVIGGLVRYLVVIGGGLLENMSKGQIKAVLSHEIAHVARRDVLRLLPLSAACGTFFILCVIYFVNPLFATEEVIYILAGMMLSGIFALPTFWTLGFFMRKMEFRADRLAVEYLGEGALLDAALLRLADLNDESVSQKYWSHPSIEDRVKAIRALPNTQ